MSPPPLDPADPARPQQVGLLDEELDLALPAWSLPRILHRIGRVARYDGLTLERQLPFTAVYVVGVLLVPLGVVPVDDPRYFALSIATVVLHLLLTVFVPWPRLPDAAKLALPVLQLEAVALLWVSTPPQWGLYALMIALPMVGFGLLPGRLGVWVGVPLVFVVGYIPVVNSRGGRITTQATVAALFLPLVGATVALSVNEITRRLRRRTEALIESRVAQDALLARERQGAAELARYSHQLREARDLWEGLVESATAQAIVATDAAGMVDVFNPGAVELLGIPDWDVVGRPVEMFFDEEEVWSRAGAGTNGEGLLDILVGEAATGGSPVRDWTMVRPDGERLTARIAVTSRGLVEGRSTGYLFVATDVTEEREAARLKDEFVSLVSHELRTPISSVLGYVALLREGEDDEQLTEEQSGYLDVVERNARRLLRLVGDLLLAAQVDAGRFHVTHQPVDLTGVVGSAVETAAPLARASGVGLRWAGGEPLTLDGDRLRLGQVADNLISNAIKFTPRGGEVTVLVEAADLSGDPAVSLQVRDTGIGIPADELDHLFERFFRASSATRRAIPGVGLGLPVTKAIVEAHGGTIRAESEPDRGTTFTVLIPTRAVGRGDAEGPQRVADVDAPGADARTGTPAAPRRIELPETAARVVAVPPAPEKVDG